MTDYTFLDADKKTQIICQRILNLEAEHFSQVLRTSELEAMKAVQGGTSAEDIEASLTEADALAAELEGRILVLRQAADALRPSQDVVQPAQVITSIG